MFQYHPLGEEKSGQVVLLEKEDRSVCRGNPVVSARRRQAVHHELLDKRLVREVVRAEEEVADLASSLAFEGGEDVPAKVVGPVSTAPAVDVVKSNVALMVRSTEGSSRFSELVPVLNGTPEEASGGSLRQLLGVEHASFSLANE